MSGDICVIVRAAVERIKSEISDKRLSDHIQRLLSNEVRQGNSQLNFEVYRIHQIQIKV